MGNLFGGFRGQRLFLQSLTDDIKLLTLAEAQSNNVDRDYVQFVNRYPTGRILFPCMQKSEDAQK